jgi:hypothetical protein
MRKSLVLLLVERKYLVSDMCEYTCLTGGNVIKL